MAFIDLVEFRTDPDHSVHGVGSGLLQEIITRDEDFSNQVLEARDHLHIPEGEHVLGLDELGRLLGDIALREPDA